MTHDRDTARFVALLTGHQHRLYAYITAMVPDLDTARDILQNTNMVLWDKAGEFEPGTNFGAWAAKIAYFQALAHLKQRKSDRHVFDAALMADLAARAEAIADTIDDRQAALRTCMSHLNDDDRQLIRDRYMEAGSSVHGIAERLGKSVGAISQRLYRVRAQLADCINRRLAEQEAGR